MGEEWRIQFHEGPRARGSPVRGTFTTRREAERAREALQANLADAERARGAHFSLLVPPRPTSLSKAIFRRKEPSLGAKRRGGGVPDRRA
jgi:hypothetical protein